MQPEQLEALAGEVALLIKAALGPVLERMAATDAQLARLPAHEHALGDLRDRVISAETKAVAPAPPGLDLTPVLERLAAAEARLQTLGDLRDQVVVLETKAAIPVPPADLGDVRHRLLTLETRLTDTVADVRQDLAALEQTVDKDGIRLEGYTASLQREAAVLSERVAVVETRAPLPGPCGQNGADGRDGKDGVDGLGFDDLDVTFDGDRRLELCFERAGGRAKSFPIVLPFLRYQGVYQDGKTYDIGDVVTWAGSTWHCNEPTTAKPGEGSKAWTLMVKRGRDGKDGVDAPGALPVVKVR